MMPFLDATFRNMKSEARETRHAQSLSIPFMRRLHYSNSDRVVGFSDFSKKFRVRFKNSQNCDVGHEIGHSSLKSNFI